MLSLSSILSNGEIQKLVLESESKEGQNTGSVGAWNGSQVAAQLRLSHQGLLSQCLAVWPLSRELPESLVLIAKLHPVIHQ